MMLFVGSGLGDWYNDVVFCRLIILGWWRFEHKLIDFAKSTLMNRSHDRIVLFAVSDGDGQLYNVYKTHDTRDIEWFAAFAVNEITF